MAVHHYEKVYLAELRIWGFICRRCNDILKEDGTPLVEEAK